MTVDGIEKRLQALEDRVELLELRARVLRPASHLRILVLLGDVARNSFIDPSFGLSLDTIGNATGLSGSEIELAMGQLKLATFVERTPAGEWRITEDGLLALPEAE